MSELSGRQLRVFDAVAHFVRQGVTPTVPELVRHLGLAKESGLTPTLLSIQGGGFISIRGGGGCVRTVDLTRRGFVEAGVGFPVLGTIPAGIATEAIEQWIDVINPGNALRGQRGDFFLVVQGDSMLGDGILPHDRVLIRPEVQVNSGEIAAVQLRRHDGQYEATLKHVHFLYGSNEVQIRASNPAYADLVLPAGEVKIAGVYRGLIRTMV